MAVVCAYDDVNGTEAYVLAVTDRDDAWLAIEAGGERALREWE